MHNGLWIVRRHSHFSLIQPASQSPLPSVGKIGRQLQRRSYMKSQAALIESLPSYHSGDLAERDALNSKTGLQSVEWLESYRADPANEAVLTAGAMLSNNAKLPPDHIVSTDSEHVQSLRNK